MRHILIVLICCSQFVFGQDYSLFKKTFSDFDKASKITDTRQRQETFNTLWNSLKESKRIPLVVEDSVLFFYQGEGENVQWTGDFNGWGYDKKFNSTGKKFAGSDIWYLKSSFPKNARLDYKIIVNSNEWLIDPDNDFQQWSGVGGGSPNSELRM